VYTVISQSFREFLSFLHQNNKATEALSARNTLLF
jgi:hypothetical protein